MVGRDQYGCISPAFSGSPWWGEFNMATSPLPSRGPHGGERSIWLYHPMVRRDQYGYISPACLRSPWWEELNMIASPMPSQGAHGGEESRRLNHLCLLGVPMVGRDQHGRITPAFSGSPWWGEINMATSPMSSLGPHGGEESRRLHHTCLLGVPMVEIDQYGYITPW